MTRKAKQYRYLRGVVYPMLLPLLMERESGIKSLCDVHEWCKQKIGIPSTAELTDDQRSEYILQIQIIGAEEFHIYIPDPNEPESYFNQKTKK